MATSMKQIEIEYVNLDDSKSTSSKRKLYIALCLILTTLVIAAAIVLPLTVFKKDIEEATHKDESLPFRTNETCKYKHPQYPQAGGAGCSEACGPGLFSAGLDYEVLFNLSRPFLTDMLNAAKILNATDPKPLLIDEYNLWQGIHITIDYFCCYNKTELYYIDEIIKKLTWPVLRNLKFEKLACVQDGDGDVSYPYNQWVELLVFFNEESQKKLFNITKQLEHLIEEGIPEEGIPGVPIHVPRSTNIDFHSTLGFVNGTAGYPTNTIVKTINNYVTWNDTNITLPGGYEAMCLGGQVNGTNYSCIHGSGKRW